MPKPRKELVSLHDTPYYHVISRCVRRSFLCGVDGYSGKNFDHRKQWVIERLDLISAVFAIKICSFALMSNHYHCVLRVDQKQAKDWSNKNVVQRWKRLFILPPIVAEWYRGEKQSKAVKREAIRLINQWRQRLYDLSWFMRCLNEHIARQANAEDGCKGRFWEGRFKSQALLDDQALLTCMAYVDLNPIRAGLSQTPEDSNFTSVQARIRKTKVCRLIEFDTAPIDETDLSNQKLPFTRNEYLDLVDWSGRIIREDKKGYIPADSPSILDRLQIDPDLWSEHLCDFEDKFHTVIGPLEKLKAYCQRIKKQWVWGQSTNAVFYSRPT